LTSRGSCGCSWGWRNGGGGGSGCGWCSSSGRRGSLKSSSEGRVNISPLDVGIDNIGISVLRLNSGGNTRGGSASSTSRSGTGTVDGVGTIKPQHINSIIIPKRHNKNHSSLERISHGGKSTIGLELISVVGKSLLGNTESISDIVVGSEVGEVGLRVGDNNSVLDIEPLNSRESTS